MATALSRKSMGVRFEELQREDSFSAMSSPRRRRSIIPTPGANLEENDDEAEKLARRERIELATSPSTPISSRSDNRRQSLGLSSIAHMTLPDLTVQIAQCIKLNAENKINDKNAFQLKMIDYLALTLKKQDVSATDLQVASTSLDVSTKIYGFRVDRVHNDLLKIVGGIAKNKDKNARSAENVNEDGAENEDEDQPKKKKKRTKTHILASEESLRGTVETYDPIALMREGSKDTQTSDMLYLAHMPIHANQGYWPNLYDDVILDELPEDREIPVKKMEIPFIEDNIDKPICLSFDNFKFLGWSPDDEPLPPTEVENEPRATDFQFDLDASLPADDYDQHEFMDHGGDLIDEHCHRLQRHDPVEKIVDFHDIIEKTAAKNTSLEYSYIQKNIFIKWAGPSHWKIIHDRNLSRTKHDEACKQAPMKKKKDIEFTYEKELRDSKMEKVKQLNRNAKLQTKTAKFNWSEEKVTFPPDMHYDIEQACNYFNKPLEFVHFSSNEKAAPTELDDSDFDYNYDNANDVSNYIPDIGGEEEQGNHDDPPLNFSLPTVSQDPGPSQFAFVGDNLVAAPKLTDKVFISYSQRAKKIDMRQLKRALWENLTISTNEKENVDLSQLNESNNVKVVQKTTMGEVCKELPKSLSKANAEALSLPIAYVSLLHLANEKNLLVVPLPDLSDLVISQDHENSESSKDDKE